MSKNQNASSNKPSDSLQKEDLIQAVVMCDNFDSRFPPLGHLKPVPLFPLVNVPLIDYTLEFLALTGVQEVILFCISHADLIREHVKNGKWAANSMQVTVLVSEGCRTLGDAMRDLDAKAVLRGDFILLHGDTVANLKLLPVLEEHKSRQKLDKGSVMTVIYEKSSPKHKSRPIKEELLLGVDPLTQRIVYHQKMKSEGKRIEVPLDVLLECDGAEMMADLCDTGISICSLAVPQLFYDNFDFQTHDDLMRGLLMNEEVLASSMYCHVVSGASYAARVNSWKTYRAVTMDIVHRWAYPLVPDCPIGLEEEAYMFLRRNVYRKRTAKLWKGCVLEEDVVLAEKCTIGENAKITRSTVGAGCVVGARTIIRDSVLWQDIHIGADCVLDCCLVADGCQLGSGTRLGPGCILPPGACLPGGPSLPRGLVLVAPNTYEWCPANADVDGDSEPSAYDAFHWESERDCSDGDSDVSASSGDESDRDSPLPDDTNLFFNEVLDSLTRGLEDRLACDNLILEINSSRYAYNVSLHEVTFHVTRALLHLPAAGPAFLAELSAALAYFRPILVNYVQRNKQAQVDCLAAIEDMAVARPELLQSVHKLLHLLYDKDILDETSILDWYQSSHLGPHTSDAVRVQAAGFIKWLQEADEESDSNDSS